MPEMFEFDVPDGTVAELGHNHARRERTDRHYNFTFPNGRGASVVRSNFTYGGDIGLWEMAVLNKDGEIDYSTPITDNVIGHCTPEQISYNLHSIARIP